MINQQALESLFLATYLEDYFDSCENLPDDVQKQATRMRELDVEYQKFLKDVEHQLTILLDCPDVQNQSIWKLKIQHALMSAQDKGDEKLQITQQIQDYMDNKVRQLDLDLKNLGYGREHESDVRNDTKVQETERPVKRARRARHEVYVPSILGPSTLEATSFSEAASASASAEGHPHSNRNTSTHAASAHNTATVVETPSSGSKSSSGTMSSGNQPADGGSLSKANSSSSAADEKSSGAAASATANNANTGSSASTPKKQSQHKKDTQEKKYKKRKKQSDNSPPNIPIDPDEPTYCLCDQVSYGEMIGCDNDLCPIEWFHFSCVQLNSKPKGKWYCPKCRGDRPNIMKPKAIFLKELEKYNREKEEKS